MTRKTAAIAALNDLSAPALANMVDADCSGPDGIWFLKKVRDGYVEALDRLPDDEIEVGDREMLEIADAVPTSNVHVLMRTVVETRAYMRSVENPPDIPAMVDLATVLLLELAQALLDALVTRFNEEFEGRS